MAKTLVISTSYRKEGNSDLLTKEVIKGLEETNKDYEVIYLRDKKINFCTGCLACLQTGHCVIKDDMIELAEKVKNTDNMVIVSPIYYYSVTGILKTFLDRCNPLFEQTINLKNVYLISPCFDSRKEAINPSVEVLKGWIECFPGVELKEYYTATSSDSKGDVLNHKEHLEYAYNLGRSI